MHLRIAFLGVEVLSIDTGQSSPSAQPGPDTESQIGTHLGFMPPERVDFLEMPDRSSY